MTRSRRSSRSASCASSASARPRSASSERSWNSSNRTPATPSSAGSSRIMRVNTPSVTTSMRVRFDTRLCRRTRRPIVSPTFSPSVAAMRDAAARAARRRGSSRMRRPPLAQGSSRSASGARVVLPAPGGATRTAFGRVASAARSAGSASSIGRGGTERDIALLFARGAAKGKHPPSKPGCRPRESGDPEIIEQSRSPARIALDPRFRGGDRVARGLRAKRLVTPLTPRSGPPSAASRGRASRLDPWSRRRRRAGGSGPWRRRAWPCSPHRRRP